MRGLVMSAFLLPLLGCQNPGSSSPETPGLATAFEGEPIPALAGKWLDSDTKSSINLESDGTMNLLTQTPTPGGTMKSKFEGEWRAKGDRLMLKRSSSNGVIVSEYEYKLSGNELVLRRPESRTTQTYQRQ